LIGAAAGRSFARTPERREPASNRLQSSKEDV
jgi:hypothetical protein